jgi:hypothetical protein
MGVHGASWGRIWHMGVNSQDPCSRRYTTHHTPYTMHYRTPHITPIDHTTHTHHTHTHTPHITLHKDDTDTGHRPQHAKTEKRRYPASPEPLHLPSISYFIPYPKCIARMRHAPSAAPGTGSTEYGVSTRSDSLSPGPGPAQHTAFCDCDLRPPPSVLRNSVNSVYRPRFCLLVVVITAPCSTSHLVRCLRSLQSTVRSSCC